MALKYATAAVDAPTPYPSLPLGGGAHKKWPKEEVAEILAAVCRQVLEQESDALIEVSFADGLISGAISVRDVVYSLSMTQLYLDKYGSPGQPALAVQHAYERLLAREAEPSGLKSWTAACQKQGLQTVLHGQVTSKEYADRFGLDKAPFPAPGHKASFFSKLVKKVVKVAAKAIHNKLK